MFFKTLYAVFLVASYLGACVGFPYAMNHNKYDAWWEVGWPLISVVSSIAFTIATGFVLFANPKDIAPLSFTVCLGIDVGLWTGLSTFVGIYRFIPFIQHRFTEEGRHYQQLNKIQKQINDANREKYRNQEIERKLKELESLVS